MAIDAKAYSEMDAAARGVDGETGGGDFCAGKRDCKVVVATLGHDRVAIHPPAAGSAFRAEIASGEDRERGAGAPRVGASS